MWVLIGVILVIIIGLAIAFGINYRRNYCEKVVNKNENILMESLNNEPYDLLKSGVYQNMKMY